MGAHSALPLDSLVMCPEGLTRGSVGSHGGKPGNSLLSKDLMSCYQQLCWCLLKASRRDTEFSDNPASAANPKAREL